MCGPSACLILAFSRAPQCASLSLSFGKRLCGESRGWEKGRRQQKPATARVFSVRSCVSFMSYVQYVPVVHQSWGSLCRGQELEAAQAKAASHKWAEKKRNGPIDVFADVSR